ncbi:MAG: SMC-Scp complex subunit ScpB [Nakamurella sp.]
MSTWPDRDDTGPVAGDLTDAAATTSAAPHSAATTDAAGTGFDDIGLEAAGAAGPVEVEDLEEIPPLPTQGAIEDDELDGALEAILLVVDTPVPEQSLASAVGRSLAEVRGRLIELAGRYAEARSGIDLREIGGGWRFYTRDRFAPVVERFVLDGQQSRLSRAALESLAVIAYRQPVTRARIAAVRGVNVDGVIRTLVARGLIEESGTDPETGGTRYRTTELFTERLGLNSLEELPDLGPLLPEVDAIVDV